MISINSCYVGFKKVTTIIIDNELGMKITLCDIGASLFQCSIKDKVLTYGPKNIRSFINNPAFFGKTIGRTTGRIKDGVIFVDNKKIRLKKWRINSLHGAYGFSFKKYRFLIGENDSEYSISFVYYSRDGEKGYPGNLVNEVIYHISKIDNSFTIELKALSDKNTVCNLTNHIYWNLDGKECSIENHKLFINADEYVKLNKDLFKEKISIVNDIFDFRNLRTIKDYLYDQELQNKIGGYDHDYLLKNPSLEVKASQLVSKDETMKLNIYTTSPVLHIYTGNFFEEKKKHHAISFEPQRKMYDIDKGAVNLNKDEQYIEITKYKFEID